VTLSLRNALRRGLTREASRIRPDRLARRFRENLRQRHIDEVETTQGDVLQLDTLPTPGGADLIVTASMLMLAKQTADALRGLCGRLGENGRLVLFITRRNWLTRPLIGVAAGNIYSAEELRVAFRQAGAELGRSVSLDTDRRS
jgi:hypothetical protein